MGNMFSKPAAVAPQPTPSTVTPMPTRDDEAVRREKIKSYAKQSERSGRDSTNLTESRLGDSSRADTRTVSTMGSVG